MKEIVTISRKYGNPAIITSVWRREEDPEGRYVEIKTSLQEFINSIKAAFDVEEIKAETKERVGSVAMVFTRAEIERRIDEAVDAAMLPQKIDKAVAKVLMAMKEEWLKHPE